jgi:hypothetical protein
MYLNAQVYIGTPKHTECIGVEVVIAWGYVLKLII